MMYMALCLILFVAMRNNGSDLTGSSDLLAHQRVVLMQSLKVPSVKQMVVGMPSLLSNKASQLFSSIITLEHIGQAIGVRE
jgi:hypothetical protein